MRFIVVTGLVASAWTFAVLQAAPARQAAPVGQAAPAGQSTWSGVYTEEQAKLGLEAYTKHCAECHGHDLAGDGYAPALKGPEFLNNWNGLTVGELYDRIRISMPPSNVNALSPKEKVHVVAYLLKQDGFPAGTSELPDTVEAMKTIKFEATKPGR